MLHRVHQWWDILCVVAITAVVFSMVLSFPFVRWDDPQLITENPLVANFSPKIFWSYDPELYIPLTFLSFQLTHLFFGFWEPAFHAVNLILHIGNAVLVLFILRRLLDHRGAALLGALLFAVHPIVVEPVAWVSARKELLCAFFVFLSFLFWIAEESRTSTISFFCALLSKVTAVMLFPILLCFDWMRGERMHSKYWKNLWVLASLTVIFVVIALLGKRETFSLITTSQFAALSLQTTFFAFRHILFPLPLSAIYPAPTDLSIVSSSTLPSLFVVLVLLLDIPWFMRRNKLAAFGLVWAALTFLPSLLAYQKTNIVTMTADRYLYLPLFGCVVTVLAFGLAWTERRGRHALAAVACAVLVFFVGQSIRRVEVWSSTEALFTDVLNQYPGQPIALNNIAFLRLQEGNLTEALALAGQAVDGNPKYSDGYANLGAIEGRLSNLDGAERDLKKALELEPTHLQAAHNLAGIYYVRGNYQEARTQYEAVLKAHPGYAPSMLQLARTQLKGGDRAGALQTYQNLLQMDSHYAGKIPELETR